MIPVIRQFTAFVVAAGDIDTLINDTYEPQQPFHCTEHPEIHFEAQVTVTVSARPGAVGRRALGDIAAWQQGRPTSSRARHPKLSSLLNDLCARGLLDAGEYRIVVRDEDRDAQRVRYRQRSEALRAQRTAS